MVILIAGLVGLLTVTLGALGLVLFNKNSTPVAITAPAVTNPTLTKEAYESIQTVVDTLTDTNKELRTSIDNQQRQINNMATLLGPVASIPTVVNEVNAVKSRLSTVESQSQGQDITQFTKLLSQIATQVSDLSQFQVNTQKTYSNQQTQIKQLYDALTELQTKTAAQSAQINRTTPTRIAPVNNNLQGYVEPTVVIDEKSGQINSNTAITPEMLKQLMQQRQSAQPQAANQAPQSQPVELPNKPSGLWAR